MFVAAQGGIPDSFTNSGHDGESAVSPAIFGQPFADNTTLTGLLKIRI